MSETKVSKINSSWSRQQLAQVEIYQHFLNSEYRSVKVDSYFAVYEELFSRFKRQPVTFVEIGVSNGGSLFMWRGFFGPNARVIGIDFNPNAKKWAEHGFEIFVGDQSDPSFWDDFFEKVGPIDILLDDGGHTNNQQIMTFEKCLPFINDGGLIVTEDSHTSYQREFGNPSKYSFMSFAKRIIDGVNSRYPGLPAYKNSYANSVYSVEFFESMVAFKIDRAKCVVPKVIDNGGKADHAVDLRHSSSYGSQVIATINMNIRRRFSLLMKVDLFQKLVRFFVRTLYQLFYKARSRRMKRYFK